MEQKVVLLEQKQNITFFQKEYKMRIALCDTDKNHIKKMKNSLYRFSNLYKFEFLVDEFQSGEELLNSKNSYCLVFLDYTLPDINGLETAKLLKAKNILTAIIFLSKETHFVFEAFKVSPYRFFTKPYCEEILFETLNEFFTSFTTNYPLWVSDGLETFCLNTGDILYLEANNKHCSVHLSNKVISCNKTMAKVFATLPKHYFQKINRAYIVNFNYIAKYNNEFVFLKNGEKLHISRNYIKIFKEEYLNFSKPKIP